MSEKRSYAMKQEKKDWLLNKSFFFLALHKEGVFELRQRDPYRMTNIYILKGVKYWMSSWLVKNIYSNTILLNSQKTGYYSPKRFGLIFFRGIFKAEFLNKDSYASLHILVEACNFPRIFAFHCSYLWLLLFSSWRHSFSIKLLRRNKWASTERRSRYVRLPW